MFQCLVRRHALRIDRTEGGGGGVTRREENEGKSSGVEDEDVSIFCNGASRAVIVGVSRTVIIDETSVLH